MKNALYLLIAILLLTTGCNRPTPTTLCNELLRAEELMYPAPDSALHILQGMTPPVDELNRATWALFTTQAKYKLFITQSDSLLNIAFPYFMEKGDAQRRAMVLYYRAALYREENKMEEAQEYYLKAKDEADLLDDYFLKYLIYSGLGHVYAHTLPDYAMEYYAQALEYAQSINTPKQVAFSWIASSYIDIARMYEKKKEYQLSIDNYKKAANTAKGNNEFLKQSLSLKELATIYRKTKEYKNALSCMQEVINIEKLHDVDVGEVKYLTLGRIYKELDLQDSVIYNFKKALRSPNIRTKIGAYSSLFYAYKKKGEYQNAAKCIEEAWQLKDSIAKIEKSQALIEMQEKYNEQRVRDELTTQMLLHKQRTWTLIGIGMIVLITTALFITYRIRLRNKERIARLAEAEDRIDTLSRMLEEAQKATSEEEKDQAFIKRILLQQLGVIRLVANTPTAQNQALLRRLAEIGNDEAPAEELIVWSDLYPIIDRLFDNFHARLMQRFGSVLTDKEVQTCCLVCAGFSTKEIAVITRQAVSTVYIRKTTARQKMGAPEGADIVEWVKSM
jgi:tetratricopeptide (TPR) repeat protein/DNA-binding CsgD family transcriptional regulator